MASACIHLVPYLSDLATATWYRCVQFMDRIGALAGAFTVLVYGLYVYFVPDDGRDQPQHGDDGQIAGVSDGPDPRGQGTGGPGAVSKASRIQQKPDGPTFISRSSRSAKRIASSQEFVDLLVRAVELERARTDLQRMIDQAKNAIFLIQEKLEDARLFYEALSKREVPEVHEVLESKLREVDQLDRMLECSASDGKWQLDIGLRDYVRHLQTRYDEKVKVQDRVVARLLEHAQEHVSASLSSRAIGMLPVTPRFCTGLQEAARGKEAFKEDEAELDKAFGLFRQQHNDVQKLEAILSATSSRVNDSQADNTAQDLKDVRSQRKASEHRLKAMRERMVVLKANQRDRVSRFLLDNVLSVLQATGRIQPDCPPNLPATPTSLPRLDDAEKEPPSYIHTNIDESELTKAEKRASNAREYWQKARKIVRDAQLDYDQLLERYRQGLATHLATYPNGTVETFETFWEHEHNVQFEQQKAEHAQELVEAQQQFEAAQKKVRDIAERYGIEDLPLSPISLAERSDDGHATSAGTSFDAGRQAAAARTRPEILRWSRNVARGIDMAGARSPKAGGESSPRWPDKFEPTRKRSAEEDRDFLRAANKRYRQAVDERIAPEAQQRWMSAGNEDDLHSPPHSQRDQTHPHQSAVETTRDRKLQWRAVHRLQRRDSDLWSGEPQVPEDQSQRSSEDGR